MIWIKIVIAVELFIIKCQKLAISRIRFYADAIKIIVTVRIYELKTITLWAHEKAN